MPEWLVERGIGETRFALIEGGRIVEARILREGVVPAGTVLTARLIAIGRNAVARADDEEYLLPKGAPGLTEGAALSVEVTREALAGAEPWKRPLARVTDEAPRPMPPIEGRLLPFPPTDDELERAGWSDLLDEARSGIIAFPGGELRVCPTPAMTLIDVDGTLDPEMLAMAGARAAAAAIRRHGIGGSIGIDLPTIGGKAARQAVAEAVDAILAQPYERTAVNGFGFLQIVRPRRFASLFELATDRASFEARALLRRAAREVGAIRLAAHPAVIAALDARPDWLDRLSRQVGGAVGLREDPSLGMVGAYAEPA
ncbi:MAG: ribonuclease [Pseudomonadota bacterium]|nr:ribonuclease [Pseudomonadota bacterium]